MAEIRTEHLLNTSLEHYLYISPYGNLIRKTVKLLLKVSFGGSESEQKVKQILYGIEALNGGKPYTKAY
jgi:hypothetical protein